MKKEEKKLAEKQPVVVLVGHIDHGKSSILQSIKDLKILEKETGGITQHIGAYEIEHNEKKITFIDTPGHEAFSAMRARGAKIADIAILVVAVDEGVKPQTKEAISHLKEARIPIIVALNKIDKIGANVKRVKSQLVQAGIITETEGGDVPCVETSAETKEGISELLDILLLVAEMNKLKSDLRVSAEGVIVESYLSPKRGPLATLLVEKGVLKRGDVVGTASSVGRVKRIEDFQGEELREARPGQGVLVLGFEDVPVFGERFRVHSDLRMAREEIKERKPIVFSQPAANPEKKTLNLILKTDVLGSIEPITEVIKALPQERMVLEVLKAEAGNISLSDVKFAETVDAAIIGFRVKAGRLALSEAEKKRINILVFDLIYGLAEGVQKLMKRTLKPERERVNLAKLMVLVVFKTDKRRQVIGAKVLKGEIIRGNRIEVFRGVSSSERLKEGSGVGNGKAVGLQINKKEVKRGKEGNEVGILFEGDTKIEEEDILVAFEQREKKIEL